jgi:glycosyltransferase involved in cell wall biosynthesis
MKFLIISQYAGAPKYGMVLRNYNWAKALVDMGHEVKIIASSYSHYRARQPNLDGKEHQEIIDGIDYHWLPGLIYDGKSNIKRLISMFQFCFQLYTKNKKFGDSYDAVIASSPQPFTVFPVIHLAKKYRTKFIYDIRDLWPLTPVHLGGFSKKHPFIRAMQYAEDVACKKANLVTCVPENARDYLVGRGMNEDKFLALGNGILSHNISEEKLPQKITKKIQDFKSNFDFVITYIGSMGRANALNSLIEAFSFLPNNIGCILIGEGPLKEDLKQHVQSEKVQDRFLFLESVPLSQVKDFLSNVDAGYCGLMKSELFEKGVSPTKLNDYMLADKPIIFSIGYNHSAIVNTNCGYACEPENPKSISESILKMSQLSEEERVLMGKRGKKWVLENAMVKRQMEKLIDKLN